jgi:hypothetical protein
MLYEELIFLFIDLEYLYLKTNLNYYNEMLNKIKKLIKEKSYLL